MTNIVDDWFKQKHEENKAALGLSEDQLVKVHRALHDEADIVTVGGDEYNIHKVDEKGKLYNNVRINRCFVGTQNLRKDSKNAIKTKVRRRTGKTYDLTWVIHDDRGYIARVLTDDDGTTVDWL